MLSLLSIRFTFALLCATAVTLGFASASQATTYRQVSAVSTNTCAVTTDDTVKCWGTNGSGELGNGTFDQSTTPTDVLAGPGDGPLTGVKSVTAGYTPCALMLNGTVKCWGWNGWPGENLGLLGVDDFDHPDSPYPLTVVAAHGSTNPLSNVVELSGHCARLASGRIKCWGNNDIGQLGDGTTTNRAAPVFVRTSAGNPNPLDDVRSISGLSTHTCAALNDTRVKCWGDNSFGQVNASNDTSITAPTYVKTGPLPSQQLSGIKSVHIAGVHTCALTFTGRIKCWGLEQSGSLGRGFGLDVSPLPYPFADFVVTAHGSSTPVSGITAISGECLVRDDTTAGCWGENPLGELGDDTLVAKDAPSTVVESESSSAPLTGVLSISGGTGEHGCAVLDDGSLRCWGWNEVGQVGDGTTTTRLAPVQVG